MKNTFKTLGTAFIIAVSLAACSGNKTGGSADSSRVDSSTVVKTTTDTLKTDTLKRDTATLKADTPAVKVTP